ncbi:hypothetical protein Noda2021_06280 [Candidatus Dependentiae bacterium Noda2021]|nr:hypothetical protein Noda2021_06280 [Candidatus Dependentiae bacterium Noda2021]
MYMSTTKFFVSIGLLATCLIKGMDNPQFYAATQFFPALQETRIVKNGLSSLDIVISGVQRAKRAMKMGNSCRC